MSDTITIPTRKANPREKEEWKSKILPPYHVILLNDDDHSFEYVIRMLQSLFVLQKQEKISIVKNHYHLL